jgi:hypothetical protein
MKNGQLWLFKPLKEEITISGSTFLGYPRDVVLDIDGIINIEDNLNDAPSNMKVRAITSATYRENFEVNTVIYHQDTDTWWVIKTDTSTYLQTGEYEHELELEELLEYYSYRHLPNCAFAPNTYTLEQMLERLFYIGKVPDISLEFPNFLDKDKQMPFLSFENYTIANALKNIGRVIDGIPRIYIDVQTSGSQVYYREQDIELTFLNRAGLDAPIKDVLNDQFPTQYERNLATKDQYLTRSISNIQNAKSTNLVVAPQIGGFPNVVPGDVVFNSDNRLLSRVFAPSKIDEIVGMNVLIPVTLQYTIKSSGATTPYFYGYFFELAPLISAINDISSTFLTSAEKTEAIGNLPSPTGFYSLGSTRFQDVIDKNYNPDTADNGRANMFFKKMNHANKQQFDAITDTDEKDRTAHFLPNTNEIIMPLSLRNGIDGLSDHNDKYVLLDKTTFTLTLDTNAPVANEFVLVQILYNPISDIKVSIDNDDDAQNERFFNQSGKVVDSFSTTQMITAHTRDSSASTKIRNARYEDFTDILPLGQLVRDSNEIYVISQRSLDCQIANGNEYYNVLYTLTRNRTSRSENILADSAVINYVIPDSNLVKRSQLYKDYFELSLTDGNKDTPYLSMSRAFQLTSSVAGSNFDFTALAKNDFGSSPTTVRYVKNPSIFDLYKAKIASVDWQDNNVLGFEFSRVLGNLIQTPLVYTDNIGGATNFELLFLSNAQLRDSASFYNDNFTPVRPLIPFDNINNVTNDYYATSVIDENQFLIRIQEPDYDKDPFEIPVFEYMIQANDDYDPKGNVVVGANILKGDVIPSGNITYHYVISSTRFTAENANKIFADNTPSSTSDKRVIITRSGASPFTLSLFSSYTNPSVNTPNATSFNHIGVYAMSGSTLIKFLFAINDYTMASTSAITLYINNWRI